MYFYCGLLKGEFKIMRILNKNKFITLLQQKGFSLLPVVIVIAVLLIGAGAYFFSRNNSTSPKTQASPVNSQDATVNWKTYTNSSYTVKYPSRVSVNQKAEEFDGNFTINKDTYLFSVLTSTTPGSSLYELKPTEISQVVTNDCPSNSDGQKSCSDSQPGPVPNSVQYDLLNRHYASTNTIIKNGNVIYRVDLGINNPNTPISAEAKQLYNQILSTFKFTDQAAGNSNSKKFTSTSLGISFSYLENQNQGHWTITVKEMGDKACVTYDTNDNDCSKGQYVQVFQKTPADTLENAITKQFLKGYSTNDCFVTTNYPYTNIKPPLGFPSTYRIAVISFPAPTDPNTGMQNANKCPRPYTAAGGLAYFLEDTNHPDKLFFFHIGQYGIEAENKLQWNQTVEIQN